MSGRVAVAALLLAALIAGTASDAPKANAPRRMGGYEVLSADFHVHSFPSTWSTLSPVDTVIEARRQGLDVIAMTPHNSVWAAKAGAWFARRTGGPIVLVGEEIASMRYHMLAVGIRDSIPPSLPASRAIDEIHRQGGVAIAAHPYQDFWPAYDADATRKLDGTEVVRPEAQHSEDAARELRQFRDRTDAAAIGASDYHGIGPLGYSRTYVFARQRTAEGVLAAIRAGRTVVYDRERAFGDAEMIAIAAANGGLPSSLPEWPREDAAARFSATAALAALTLAVVMGRD